MTSKKEMLAAVARASRLDAAGFALQRAQFSPFIRAVNYHDVSPQYADAFDRQLKFYAKHFECVGVEGLLALQAGRWESEKPGIIISFDDGLRSHAEVAAPLLERHDMVGWFMVPIAFVDTPPTLQETYAREHLIDHAAHDYGDPRIALSWDQVRALSERHVIGCHTWNHTRLTDSLNDDQLFEEIPRAKKRLESELSAEVPVFAWVGGEERTYSRGAAEAIKRAGFEMSFMTNNQLIRPGCDLLQLQRTNVEAWDSESIMRLQISGLFDLIYRGKRERVNRLTRIEAS
jgi:peptidoglycan/xylan/chitin deacetylase (PgdA/CDA1 family)